MFGQAFWALHWLAHLSLRTVWEVKITWISWKMWLCRCWICLYSHDGISIWYPLYGAPAYFTLPWLDHHFPGRWTGRGNPVAWQARSPDLTPLDFFHWGCMKENVYETEIASREDLVSKINTTAMDIRQRGLGNIQREIRRRAKAFVLARGGHFEHML